MIYRLDATKRVTTIDDRARTCVKSDTVKLSQFQDDDDMDLEDMRNSDAPDLDITTIQAIAALRSSLAFSEESITSDIV